MFDELARAIHEDRLAQAQRLQRLQGRRYRAVRWHHGRPRPSA